MAPYSHGKANAKYREERTDGTTAREAERPGETAIRREEERRRGEAKRKNNEELRC